MRLLPICTGSPIQAWRARRWTPTNPGAASPRPKTPGDGSAEGLNPCERHRVSPFATAAPQWRRSAHCGASNTCVEIAALFDSSPSIGARDAKHGAQSPVLSFSHGEWLDFLERAKKGEFDLRR
ncbi:DUF397 domain-containing protein [Actinomadura bangladeshensis]|uniref:DUF397 domain-containing protein n=1 Tax=Actinomadura bangladeshensis TaxID=453573 RepID=A0A4R4NQL0_9ACTN|nr:DUF397 domain-containing protein [Actinomadura bangladeshensis]